MNAPKTYALYKGDDMLDVGTLQEIADRRGVKPDTIRHYMSPAYKRKRDKWKNPRERLCTVALDDDDEEEHSPGNIALTASDPMHNLHI